jgi:hypothetical protein
VQRPLQIATPRVAPGRARSRNRGAIALARDVLLSAGMETKELKKMNRDAIRGSGFVLIAPPWPAESVQRDKLTSPRPLREPHFNDGDLLHGEGP